MVLILNHDLLYSIRVDDDDRTFESRRRSYQNRELFSIQVKIFTLIFHSKCPRKKGNTRREKEER